MSSYRYFYCVNDQVEGPYEWDNIVQWVNEGSIPSECYLQDEQQSMEWTLYGDLLAQYQQSEQAPTPAQTWEYSVWHYLDDDSVVQGPYTTATIGDWLHMGALTLDRYCSIDGADWIQLQTTEPYLTLWAPQHGTAPPGVSGEEEPGAGTAVDAAPPRGRRQSVAMAAQRCHARRTSVAAQSLKQTKSAPSNTPTTVAPSSFTGGLASKLNDQKNLLRKTNRSSNKHSHGQRPERPPKDSAQNALMQGLQLRRTIITRGKKRRSSMADMNRPVFRMADGSAAPEAIARGPRIHKRQVSYFSEEDDDDDWLSD